MKKDKILTIIIIIVGILILGESYNIVRTLSIKPNKIEEIQTNNILSNDKSIAIWVQDSEGEEWHEADNRDSWPSPTTHGFVGAECTDSDGKEIDVTNILHFDLSTYHATIDTKNSIYCTLYFAKGEPALDHLKAKGGNTFAGGNAHTTAVDGMYRFKGDYNSVKNNYICFGTTVASTCTSNKDKYMYRIIGITSQDDTKINLYANQLKIIKATPSNTSQAWSSNSDIKWGSSSAKTYLNGTSSNQFLNTITSLPDGTYWNSMISQHGWYIKDQTSIGTTEPQDGTLSGDTNNRIGLMYATDYKNSGDSNTNNWLHITHGTSDSSSKYGSTYEWTMTRYGYRDGYYIAWSVETYGALGSYIVYNPYEVRPVFYLQSGVNLTGEGTEANPYIITTKNNA